jgi:hypothetical protein
MAGTETLQARRKEDTQTQAVRAREARNARAREARRKAVIGGVVQKMVSCGELPESWIKDAIARHAADRDKKLFSDGYAKTLEAIRDSIEGRTTPTTIGEIMSEIAAEIRNAEN